MSDWSRDAALRFAAQQKLKQVRDAKAIRDQTGAACVAWEGSGAARAALFNGIGSLEIRAVTDAADKEAPQRFDANLPIAMANLASLLRLWLE